MKTSPSFVDSPLYHHKNEENQISVKEMEICKTEQNSLLSYLSQFDYKISNTLNRQRTLINGRYLTMMNHLEKVRKQLEIYENKVNSLEKEIDENEKIKKIIIELNIQKKYHDLLENKMNQLFGVMQINQKELKENLELIKLKKNTIFQVNHQNLLYEERIRKLKTFINRKKNILPKIKGNTNILNSNSSVINTTFEGHSKNNFSISYNEKVLDLKNGIKDKMAAFFGIKQLFEECFQLQIKQFTKSQQVIKENGLKDSLLFQIKTKNNEFDVKYVNYIFFYLIVLEKK